jgi:hypothetical protein
VWEHAVETDLEHVVARISVALRNAPSGVEHPDWRVVSVCPVEGAGTLEDRRMETLRTPEIYWKRL